MAERSRYSDWAYRLKDPEFDSQQDEVYLFYETFTPFVGPILPPIQRVPRHLSPRRWVKPEGPSVYYIPPISPSVESKNERRYNATSRVCLHGVDGGQLYLCNSVGCLETPPPNPPSLFLLHQFLGTFAKLQKATISFVMSVRLSVHTQQLCSH